MAKSDDKYTARMKAIRRKYPPVDVAPFLRMQRRWIRRVNQMHDLTHAQRCAAIFIGAFGTPDAPFCAASLDYICRHVNCERTVVWRAVTKLEKLEYMSVDRMTRGGNVYVIKLPI